MIKRPEYLNKLIEWENKTNFIKVVTGVRRCGKSTLFEMFQDHLKKHGVSDDQIIHINFERADFTNLLNWQELHNYVKSKVSSDKMNYLFLDEVQMVPGFHQAVNSLRLEKNIDIYITGSNAYMYSQKISTLLSGRFVEIKMFPLSFKEFLSAFDTGMLPTQVFFDIYRQFGGFPDVARAIVGASKTDDIIVPDSEVFLYIDSLYNTVVAKDISLRTGIDSVSDINRIVRYLFSNIGNKTSFNNIMNAVNAEFNFNQTGKNLYVSKIQKIVEALKESFLFYACDRQMLKGKELLRTESKYYAVDTGLRYFMLGGDKNIDGGHVLENIVYIELLRRGYRVSTGRVDDLEVDFVAEKANNTEYFQVSLSLDSEKTFEREMKSLEKIQDNYEKTVLVFAPTMQSSYKGIKIINVIDWLLGEKG